MGIFKFLDFLPAPPPSPPVPRGLLPGEEEVEEVEETVEDLFRMEMESDGFDPELVEMGLKVMKNHLRSPREAFEIGRNYVREMAK